MGPRLERPKAIRLNMEFVCDECGHTIWIAEPDWSQGTYSNVSEEIIVITLDVDTTDHDPSGECSRNLTLTGHFEITRLDFEFD